MLTPSDGSAEPRIPGCRWLGWPLAWFLRFVSRVSISMYLIATLQGISKCLLRHCHFVGGQTEPLCGPPLPLPLWPEEHLGPRSLLLGVLLGSAIPLRRRRLVVLLKN